MHAYSFLPSFLPSFLHSCMHAFIHSFIHSFMHSVIQSFSHSVIQSFSPSFVRSFIHSRSFWLQILCVSIHLDFRSTSGPKWHDWTCFQVHRWYTSLHQTLRSDSGPFWLAQWKRSLHMQKPLSIVESPKPTLFCPSSGSTHFGTDHLSTPQILVLTRVCQYAAGGRPCLVLACWLGGLNLSCAGGDLASYSLPQHGIDLSCTFHNKLATPEQRVFCCWVLEIRLVACTAWPYVCQEHLKGGFSGFGFYTRHGLRISGESGRWGWPVLSKSDKWN